MKHVTLTAVAVLGLSFTSYAQLGGLMKKATDMRNQAKSAVNSVAPAGSGTSTTNSRPTTTTPTTTTTTTTPKPSSPPADTYDPSDPVPIAPQPERAATNVESPVHTRNRGKIVFVLKEEDLAPGQENEATFVKTHTYDHFLITAEPLYARAYMTNTIHNGMLHVKPNALFGEARLKVYVDGTLASTDDYDRMHEEEKDVTVLDFVLKSPNGGGMPLDAAVRQAKEKLTPGQHQLRVELVPVTGGQEGEVLASGDLALTVKAKPPRELSKTCLPAAGMKDPALEAKIMAAFNAKHWQEKFKSARIVSTEWYHVRNQYTGIITKRSLSAVVAATENGECRYQVFVFSQDAADKGYQSTLYMDGIGDVTYVKCECFK